jgi:hypothetical protein
MKMLTKISTMVAFACVCSAMAAVQTNDAKKLSRDKHGSYSRLMRVTMKDGATEEFLMESVKNLTFAANPNDSSDIDEKPPVEDPELPDEPDRTPEARSMSSSATESSSSDWYGPEVKSSDSKSSSSSEEQPSSSAKSSDSKSSDKSSCSSVKQSSSSEATTGIPTIDYAGTRIMWTPKKQTLSVFSRQAGNAKFTLFDAQGVTVGSGNVYVSRGSTSLSLEYLNLPKGTFVMSFEIGNTKIQQKISVTGK